MKRIWIASIFWLFCFGHLSEGHAQSSEDLGELLLRKAPNTAREVRVGVHIEQITFVDQKAENFGVEIFMLFAVRVVPGPASRVRFLPLSARIGHYGKGANCIVEKRSLHDLRSGRPTGVVLSHDP